MKRPTHAPGYTLVELLLSLVIVAVLLGAMGSLVVASARSVPGRGGVAEATTAASAFLEQFEADIAAAEVISLADPSAIEVSVGDRDLDGKSETIRYEWSGAAGDPVIRVYNNEPVALNVSLKSFALKYATVTSQSIGPDTVTDQPEISVGGFSGGLLLFASRVVNASSMVSQGFIPTLPAGTRTWTITRVKFLAMADLIATGTTSVQIRTVGSDGLPTDTILASVAVAENSLAALLHGERTVTFTGVPPLAPGQEIAIVFQCTAACASMTMGYVTPGGSREPLMAINGPAWSPTPTGVIPHEVWAKTTLATPNIVTTKRVERITAQVTVPGSAAPLRVSIPLHNQPEVQ